VSERLTAKELWRRLPSDARVFVVTEGNDVRKLQIGSGELVDKPTVADFERLLAAWLPVRASW